MGAVLDLAIWTVTVDVPVLFWFAVGVPGLLPRNMRMPHIAAGQSITL